MAFDLNELLREVLGLNVPGHSPDQRKDMPKKGSGKPQDVRSRPIGVKSPPK
jgi:hypothetical protein